MDKHPTLYLRCFDCHGTGTIRPNLATIRQSGSPILNVPCVLCSASGYIPVPPLTIDEIETMAIALFEQADRIAQERGDPPIRWEDYEHQDWYRARVAWVLNSLPERFNGVRPNG